MILQVPGTLNAGFCPPLVKNLRSLCQYPSVTEFQVLGSMRGMKKEIEEGGEMKLEPLSRWEEQGHVGQDSDPKSDTY